MTLGDIKDACARIIERAPSHENTEVRYIEGTKHDIIFHTTEGTYCETLKNKPPMRKGSGSGSVGGIMIRRMIEQYEN